MAGDGSVIAIRRARADDAESMLECLSEAFESYRDEYTPGGFADTVLDRGALERRMAEMSLFVATGEAGEIVGTIGCAPASSAEGHIRGMAVRPDWHGRGVAGRLLAAAEAELRDLGCGRVSLDTTAPLQRAVRFYERNGYRASGKVADFFGMPLFEYVKPL